MKTVTNINLQQPSIYIIHAYFKGLKYQNTYAHGYDDLCKKVSKLYEDPDLIDLNVFQK